MTTPSPASAGHQFLDALAAADDPLSALAVVRLISSALADATTPDLVRAARTAGASWQQIGDALGISKQAAQQRYISIDPTRWDGVAERCAAAGELLGDTDLCEGDREAVKIFESSRSIPGQAAADGGTLACVRHGAKLYARIDPSRSLVYPVGGPNRPDQPAIAVYTRAQKIRKGSA